MSNFRREEGFTLVELSIVIVIIGLIVGGILVGQDLIKAAEVRAQVSQIEGYQATVNTFKSKYNAIPGDLSKANVYFANTHDSHNGNGNGILEGGTSNAPLTGTSTTATYEITFFWEHLSKADMINGSFNGIQTGATVGESFPKAKIGTGGIGVYHNGVSNVFHIGVANASGTTYSTAPNLTAADALGIDTKMDDGLPLSGSVRAVNGISSPAVYAGPGTDATSCLSGHVSTMGGRATTETDDYLLSNDETLCQLQIRMN